MASQYYGGGDVSMSTSEESDIATTSDDGELRWLQCKNQPS